MNILRRLASTSVVSKPAIPTASKINAVFTSLRNVFKSRSHQSFELETWKAYLDLEGADKAQSPPGLYSRMLVFVAANNMHSHKHKLLAFQLLDKDINISKNYAPNLMTAKPWNWDFVSLQAKLYQFAFDNDGVKKSIEQVQKYLLRAQIITPEHLQDALAAMIYVRYHLNGIEDAANWMEELLEIEWQTQNGPIKIPWETRVCKIVYKKLYNAGLSYEKFLGRCNSFGIPLDDSVVKVRMLLRDGDVESAIKIAEISAPKNSISDTVNELIGYHILSRHSSVKDLNLKNPKSAAIGTTREQILEKGSAFLSKVVVKSTLSYNAVLVFHLHSKEFGLVYQKFEEFLESGFVPDIKSLTVVVQALFMLNKIKKVDEILDLYTNGDYKIDSMFIQIVVTGYIRAKFVEKANYFYGYFIQQGFEPSEKLYASLICNYCHVGDLGTASYLYQAFLDLNYKPTHSLHMAFIKGYCVRRDYESAMSVFNSMENLNLVPDTYTFNSAIKLFIKAGKRGQALNLLEQMSRQCVEKNHITSCLMIHFHSRFGTEQELLQACKDHHLGGHKMDEYCLLRLVEFYSRNGNFTRALEYANRIAHLETVERPSYAHNVILNLLRRDTLNPQSIIDYMNSLLVTDIPDCKTLGIYIKALSESGRYELMESVIENEVIRRVKPDISLIGIIIDSYLRADNKKRCLDWYKYLQKNGMTPSPFIRRTMSFVEKMDMFQSRSKSMYHLFTSLTSHLRYGKNIAAKVRRMGKIRSYQKALVNETNEAKKKRLQSLIKRLNFRDVELANRRFRRRMVMKGKNPQATLRKNEVTAHAIARKLPVIIDSFKEYHVPFSAKTAIPADSKLLKVV